MMRVLRSTPRVGLLALVVVRLVAGYIDPNTGGMLFQLLAGFLAAFTAILLYFSRQIRMSVARFARFLRGFLTR